MTALTASGWLWAAWCVFALGGAIVELMRWIDDTTKGAPPPAHEWFVALLSLAWFGWLVAP